VLAVDVYIFENGVDDVILRLADVKRIVDIGACFDVLLSDGHSPHSSSLPRTSSRMKMSITHGVHNILMEISREYADRSSLS
jgi:hypothetical protein